MKIRLFIIGLLIVLAGCQNRGDIGVLYGQWTVDEVTLNGEKVTDYPYGEVYFNFQTELVAISVFGDDHEGHGGWTGTWSRTDKTITLDFDHYRNTPPSGPLGKLPSWLLIPPQTATTFDIEKETSRAFIISYVNTDGNRIKYTLRKII